MTKAQAKRNVYRCLALLVDPYQGHENGFLYVDQQGNEYPEADTERMKVALDEIVAGFYRKSAAQPTDGPTKPETGGAR